PATSLRTTTCIPQPHSQPGQSCSELIYPRQREWSELHKYQECRVNVNTCCSRERGACGPVLATFVSSSFILFSAPNRTRKVRRDWEQQAAAGRVTENALRSRVTAVAITPVLF
ncbi:hypothetical protein RRG08_060101, partial [Elysia crispata]